MNDNKKTLIYSMTKKSLKNWLIEQEEKPSRADIIWRYLYIDFKQDFSAMTDLSTELIQKLEHYFKFDALELVTQQKATDGTTKFLFRLSDGHLIETVLMYKGYGVSVCVTTQVGCNIGCKFCASGLLTKQRDLQAGEIVAQIMQVNRWLKSSEIGRAHV